MTEERTCGNCIWWDMSCYECDFPLNRVNNIDDPEYRVVRYCGESFGCISFERKRNDIKKFLKEKLKSKARQIEALEKEVSRLNDELLEFA